MRGRERGIVLVVVLFFALLLASTVATFARKALIDHMIIQNRDARARADALARGGLRLATALLLEDRFRESQTSLAVDNQEELWAQVSGQEIALEDGSSLMLRIEDAGSRLNLNGVVSFDEAGNPDPSTVPLLTQLLEKAIAEIPLPPGEKVYDVAELAASLIDFIDENDVGQRGGLEDDVYQTREPPTHPANRPLLWVDELRKVEGFDAYLVDALRPYVTVYPYSGGGINPNTAPPYVLGLLFLNDGVDFRLAPEDTVRAILKVREEGQFLCGEQQSGEGCVPMSEVVTNANSIYPPLRFSSNVFVVTASARVGDVRRSVEAVLDRSQAASPLLLSWRVL